LEKAEGAPEQDACTAFSGVGRGQRPDGEKMIWVWVAIILQSLILVGLIRFVREESGRRDIEILKTIQMAKRQMWSRDLDILAVAQGKQAAKKENPQ
jgi:hypothetical protein